MVVPGGQNVSVKLECSLLNCGVTLKISPDFLTTYPQGVLYLKQNGTRLMHSYSEKRIAYFYPGSVELTLYNEAKEKTLLTRTLAARDILSIKISAPSQTQASGTIKIAVDTTGNWRSESYVIGGSSESGGSGNSGEDLSDAISVNDASKHIGDKGVWVYGYIVGGDLTSSGTTVTTSGVSKATHIAIAARSSIKEKESCVAVELPSGKVRDALNLVDHPDLIGTRVYVKGNLVESYFNTTGLKSTSDYALK